MRNGYKIPLSPLYITKLYILKKQFSPSGFIDNVEINCISEQKIIDASTESTTYLKKEYIKKTLHFYKFQVIT